MMTFLSLVLHVVVSPFKTKARLEAEIIMLRHQLNVLRRHDPSKPKLAMADRLLFVWLYRLFPSVLNAIAIVRPETRGLCWARVNVVPVKACGRATRRVLRRAETPDRRTRRASCHCLYRLLAVTPLARLPFTASVPALIIVPPV